MPERFRKNPEKWSLCGRPRGFKLRFHDHSWSDELKCCIEQRLDVWASQKVHLWCSKPLSEDEVKISSRQWNSCSFCQIILHSASVQTDRRVLLISLWIGSLHYPHIPKWRVTMATCALSGLLLQLVCMSVLHRCSWFQISPARSACGKWCCIVLWGPQKGRMCAGYRMLLTPSEKPDCPKLVQTLMSMWGQTFCWCSFAI